MGNKKSFSERMKDYEKCYDFRIPARTYTIIRLDGKGFSRYTEMFDKPFDDTLSNVMDAATVELCKFLNPKLAYTQSDEISLMFTDIENIDSELIFDGKVQKLCSISASKITAAFNKKMLQMLANFKYTPEEIMQKVMTGEFAEIDAVFDSRVYVIPDYREVSNYFIYRQQDCTRNSISMAADVVVGKSATKGKNGNGKQEMMFQNGVNWNDYKAKYKRGSVIKKHLYQIEGLNGELVTRSKWIVDSNTPIFTEEKEYLYDLIPTV